KAPHRLPGPGQREEAHPDRRRAVQAVRYDPHDPAEPARPVLGEVESRPIPIGRPISAANPTMITVPTMAFATPPPAWPAGTGFLTKKLQSRDEAPLATRYPRIRASARTATNDSIATSVVIRPLTKRRRRRRALTGRGSPRRYRG